jgi:hypothetical protein
MVSLQLSVADLLRCRFAISPVNEVGEAGRAIANPPALAAHRAWLREHDPALQRLATAHDFRPLFALLHPRVHTPELLRPPPRAAAGEIDVELEQIAATSKKRVRSEVERCLNSRGRVVQEVDRPLRSRDAAARLAEMLAALATSLSRRRGHRSATASSATLHIGHATSLDAGSPPCSKTWRRL